MAFLPVWSTHLLGEWGGMAWESPTLGVVGHGRVQLGVVGRWAQTSSILNSSLFIKCRPLGLKDIVIFVCQTQFDLV